MLADEVNIGKDTERLWLKICENGRFLRALFHTL